MHTSILYYLHKDWNQMKKVNFKNRKWDYATYT